MSERNTTLLIAIGSALIGFGLKLQCYVADASPIFTQILRTCYSDVTALYFARDFDNGIIPFFEVQSDGQILEYPVLIGLQMFFASILTNVLSPDSWQFFTYVNWTINLLFIVVAVWYLHKLNPKAARWFAFSPALLLVLGINWDAMAILLMILGLYFFLQKRYINMGIALGLGMSAKLFPILVLPVAVIYLYQERNFKAILESISAAIVSWVIVNITFILFAFDGWIRFFTFSRGRDIDFGSPYLATLFLTDIRISTSVANTLGLVSVAIAYGVVFALRQRIDFLVSVMFVISVFVLMNKVYSPQFWLWLAPLFALIIHDRWNWIQWNISQVLYYFAVWAYIAAFSSQQYSLSAKAYSLFILIHFVSTIFAMSVVVRSAIRNQPQPVHDPSHP